MSQVSDPMTFINRPGDERVPRCMEKIQAPGYPVGWEYFCTEDKGHAKDHVAKDRGREKYRWPQK